jgi:hypothetical protein
LRKKCASKCAWYHNTQHYCEIKKSSCIKHLSPLSMVIYFYTHISIWSFWSYRRYPRCWWHLTLHIINIEKNVLRLLFHFFFFLICVCIPWVWLGWRWCGCVLMYFSLFRNFTFCFYWFLFYFGLLVYICVVGVFL